MFWAVIAKMLTFAPRGNTKAARRNAVMCSDICKNLMKTVVCGTCEENGCHFHVNGLQG